MSVDRVDNIKDAPEKTLSRVIGHASDGKGGGATLENLKDQMAITAADVEGAVPETREIATGGGIQGGGTLEGDLTLSLADTEVDAGTYGSATEIPVLTIGADGRVTAASTAPAAGVRTYTVLAHQLDASIATAAAGTLSGGGIVNPARCLDFDASSYEYARVFLPMPKAWDLGAIDVRIGWAPTDANAGNVLWAARASVINADDATSNFASGLGEIVSAVSAAPGAIAEMQAVTLANITPSGTPAAGSLLFILIVRAADIVTDTYAADARLVFVEVLFGVTSNSDA